MSKYALIINNNVTNIIESDENFINSILNDYDHIILITDIVCIGDIYHPETNTFEHVPKEPIIIPKYCTILEFRSKFTTAEKVAIYSAVQSNVLIQIWLDDLNAVQNNTVNLEDQRTIEGVQGLEAAGLIGTGRAAEILEM